MTTKKRRSMTVKTKLGQLTAKPGTDLHYPSIDLFWKDRLVASLEFDPEKTRIRAIVWNEENDNAEPFFIPIEGPVVRCAHCGKQNIEPLGDRDRWECYDCGKLFRTIRKIQPFDHHSDDYSDQAAADYQAAQIDAAYDRARDDR